MSAADGDGFPQDVKEWTRRIASQKERPIQPKVLAEVLNEVRFNPHVRGTEATKRPQGHLQLENITDAQIAKWMKGLGVTPEQYQSMQGMARAAGHWIPSSSTVANFVSYGVLPFLKHASPLLANPMVQAAMVIPWAALLQPIIQTPVQSLAVGALDFQRQKFGVSAGLDKSSINLKESQATIKARIDADIKALDKGVETLHSKVFTIESRLEEAGIPALTVDGMSKRKDLSARLGEAWGAANTDERKELHDILEGLQQTSVHLADQVSRMLMVEHSANRQYKSQIQQIAPRTLRSMSSLVGIPAKLLQVPEVAITALTSSVAMLMQGFQHERAGADELQALKTEIKQDMLSSMAILKPEGRKAWQQGEPIQAEHLDIEACRKRVNLPETAIAKRVEGLLGKMCARAETVLDTLKTERDKLTTARDSGVESGQDMTHLEPRITQLDADIEKVQAEVDVRRADIKAVKEGHLDEVKHGAAKNLIEQALKPGSWSLKLTEGWWKLDALEATAQLGQRLGQALTFVVGGAAGATAGGRLVAALVPNASSPTVQSLIGVGSGLVGAFASMTQWCAVMIKNERRDGGGEMSFMEQFLRSMVAPLDQWRQTAMGNKGIEAAVKYLQDLPLDPGQLLKDLNDPGDDTSSVRSVVPKKSFDPVVGPSTFIPPELKPKLIMSPQTSMKTSLVGKGKSNEDNLTIEVQPKKEHTQTSEEKNDSPPTPDSLFIQIDPKIQPKTELSEVVVSQETPSIQSTKLSNSKKLRRNLKKKFDAITKPTKWLPQAVTKASKSSKPEKLAKTDVKPPVLPAIVIDLEPVFDLSTDFGGVLNPLNNDK